VLRSTPPAVRLVVTLAAVNHDVLLTSGSPVLQTDDVSTAAFGHKAGLRASFRPERTTSLVDRSRGEPSRMDGSLAPVIRGTTVVSHTLEIPMTEQLGQTKRVG
jgi:hypothetical protein